MMRINLLTLKRGAIRNHYKILILRKEGLRQNKQTLNLIPIKMIGKLNLWRS